MICDFSAEIETLSRELERSEAARTTAESKIAELAEATARQEKENAILSQKKLEVMADDDNARARTL